jgi:drug/metabolite transporter (DMT)-like permease
MDRPDRNLAAFAGWMSAYLAAYVAIALSIRTLSASFTIIEIAILRSCGSLVIAVVLLLLNPPDKPLLADVRLRDDVARSLLHMAGSLALIWSVASLPLALVTTIEFSGPLFAALIVYAVSRRLPEKVPAFGLAMVAAGMALLLGPFDSDVGYGLLVPLGAVAALTSTNILLAKLAARRSTLTIILLMHLIQLPLYLALAAFVPAEWLGGPRPDIAGLQPLQIALIAAATLALVVGGFMTQAALANASRHGSPLQLCAADVLRVPLITLAAFLALGQAPMAEMLLPGLLVICGALVSSLPGAPERDKLAQATR